MGGPYQIHSRNGRIGTGTDTKPEDIDAIVTALREDGRGHLLLYYHGGLVDKAAGIGIAERLRKRFSQSAYPVFSVWESGFVEAIRNNLRELPGEPVFKNLVRKALEYALRHLGGSDGARSIAPGTVDAEKVRQAIDTYWNDPSRHHVPYRDFRPVVGPSVARAAIKMVDDDEIEADLQTDSEFANAMHTLSPLADKTGGAFVGEGMNLRDTAFSQAVATQVSGTQGARGPIVWFKVALLVKRILQGILRRYADQRDHGLYATVVEEVLRGVHFGGSGLNEWGKALQWNRMKQDTLDAFGDSTDLCAGTALLERLRTAHASKPLLSRITLVGHSTGAVYIANWLDKAAKLLPAEIVFDIVFLAPAVTYERFATTIVHHSDRIRHFRMFGMRDEFERDDQVVGDDSQLSNGQDWKRFIYPSSLLYLVSGVLESRTSSNGTLVDEPDMPLLGMERFFAWNHIYSDKHFPEIAAVRAWMRAAPNRAVWSKSQGQTAGLNSASIDHGAFDDDEDTLLSVESVLNGW
ncbi:hypothetical protein [Stenotrophomonas maltophilia]|uniref:hypothetical protein n=1 Tax=Stenotrophomonas maltophilia TaxID=40324 RepID=UPI0011B91F59|nr:hypothetical protein [Stenotrophomonas maltophilia]MCF3476657.1 hypothetical protein [Stenotrophomonas maltophilia]GFF08540.1 hypothetical protein SM139_3596 [Stenotrophomonas maltophilia]